VAKTASPPVSVADRLHSAAIHLLRRVRVQDTTLGLGPAQASALSIVVFGGPKRLGELARLEQVRPPTMTRIVAGLERNGLVTREPDPRDARSQIVSATSVGRVVMRRGRERRVAALRALLDPLTQDELGCLDRAAELVERVLRPPPSET
jgi:DNA-binding MarR family transcriptional regulator